MEWPIFVHSTRRQSSWWQGSHGTGACPGWEYYTGSQEGEWRKPWSAAVIVSIQSRIQPTMCIIHTEERSSRHHEHIFSYLLPPTGLHFLQQSTSCLWSVKLQSMDWYSLDQRHYYLNVSAVASHLCYRCAFTVQVVLGLIKMTMRRSHHKSPHTDKGNNVLDSLVN